jgi:DNA-binding NarL/FixJ family response regulator
MNPKVILADDETCIREMNEILLRMEKMDVVAHAATGVEALKLCRRLRPAFLLADLRLPNVDAVGVLLRLRAEKLAIPVMIYTGCEDDRVLAAALDAKPSVLVHKTDPLEDFRHGVRFAAQGRSYFSPRPARLNAMPRPGTPANALSPAETELLKLIASSKSNKMAADIVNNSEKTVSHRREALMAKLNLHDVAALTRFAVRHGLVECS